MILARFAKWFSSAAGVWQTFFAVSGWVVLEYLHVVHDDNMFQLMAWLTIYSAITQPVLAYANRQDTATDAAILAAMRALLEHVSANSDEDVAADREELVLLRQIADRLGTGGAP